LKIIRNNEAKEREKTMPEAKTRITFTEATQEAFEVFADEVAEQIPEAVSVFHDTPIFGGPYVMVHYKSGDPWDAWVLSVDAGEDLCIADRLYWVEPSIGLQ
jgi:hypothetical protein